MERSETAAQPDVRAQLAHLLDPGSFVEIDAIAEHDCEYFGMKGRREIGDGLVSGTGLVNGRRIVVYAHDARFLAGSSGKMHSQKIGKAIDLALKIGCPIVALNNSSGIRIHEGIDAGVHFGDVFFKTVKASGIVPQISIILGDCAGGAAYTPSLTDFIIMTEERGNMFLTGPAVIKAATGEDVTKEQIGGARMHAEITGQSQFLVASSIEALHLVRELLGFLPQNNRELFDRRRADVTSKASNVEKLIPIDPQSPFDMTDVIRAVVDDGDFLEVHQLFARNVVVGFARIAGISIGIVANQPNWLAGALSVAASEKAARFVRVCDAFGIPLVTLIDVPGYLPGFQEETAGILKAGAKLLHAYCEATVPKIAVILRKAYGGAYPTLANRLATDMCFALPNAQIAIMGPEGAVDIIFRREIESSVDPDTTRAQRLSEYQDSFASATYAARRAYIEGIVEPDRMRDVLQMALLVLESKISSTPGRRHSNIPI